MINVGTLTKIRWGKKDLQEVSRNLEELGYLG
jgi:hypothetical protein